MHDLRHQQLLDLRVRAMNRIAIIFLVAYAFMAGTIYSAGVPYKRCDKLENTNFYTWLGAYGR